MGMVDYAMNKIVPWQPMWPEFYSWAIAAFDLTDDSWDPAGGSPPYLTSLPAGKMMMSIYLLTFALRDEYIPQWHARNDYLDAARGRGNAYHEDQDYRFIQVGDNPASEATTHDEAGDDIDMHCKVFDLDGPSDDPVNRASVMVHEAWHHWQQHHDFVSDHLPGSQDWYYPHGCLEFDFGQLWAYWVDPANRHHLFHSPYQIQVEFDADIAEYSRSFIPIAVTDSARYYGNTRLGNCFKNGVSYRIGQPRPF
jgi:hypothetical protein